MYESDTGYIVNAEIYTGAAHIIEPDLGITGNIDLRLLTSSGLASRHHILVMDSYYNSIPLATYLMNEHKTGVVETERDSQNCLKKKKKMTRGKSDFYCKENIRAWYGKTEDSYISYQTTMTPPI